MIANVFLHYAVPVPNFWKFEI